MANPNEQKYRPSGPGDRIAVIGAGPAGLSAAMYLKNRGYKNVIVLERRGEPGGKCRTALIQNRAFDLGGAYVTPSHKRALKLLKKYGLKSKHEVPYYNYWIGETPGQPPVFEYRSLFASLTGGAWTRPHKDGNETVRAGDDSKGGIWKLVKAVIKYCYRWYVISHWINTGSWSELVDQAADAAADTTPAALRVRSLRAMRMRIKRRICNRLLTRNPAELPGLARRLCESSMEEWLNRWGLQALKPVFAIVGPVMGYGKLSEVPAPYLLRHMTATTIVMSGIESFFPSWFPFVHWPRRVVGGYQRLWTRVAEELNVRTDVDIFRIERSDEGVVIHCREHRQQLHQPLSTVDVTLQFDAVIFACMPVREMLDPRSAHDNLATDVTATCTLPDVGGVRCLTFDDRQERAIFTDRVVVNSYAVLTVATELPNTDLLPPGAYALTRDAEDAAHAKNGQGDRNTQSGSVDDDTSSSSPIGAPAPERASEDGADLEPRAFVRLDPDVDVLTLYAHFSPRSDAERARRRRVALESRSDPASGYGERSTPPRSSFEKAVDEVEGRLLSEIAKTSAASLGNDTEELHAVIDRVEPVIRRLSRTLRADIDPEKIRPMIFREVMKQSMLLEAQKIEGIGSKSPHVPTEASEISGESWTTFDVWPYFPHVKTQDFVDFYRDLDAAQGKQRTFYTGGYCSFELVDSVVWYSQRLIEDYFPDRSHDRDPRDLMFRGEAERL